MSEMKLKVSEKGGVSLYGWGDSLLPYTQNNGRNFLVRLRTSKSFLKTTNHC